MPESEITVSVIVCACNAQKKLPRCLQALQEQTLQNIEVIVVDCGSEDRTHEIALEFMKASPVFFQIHRQKNAGLDQARQSGLALARGTYAAFCDAREAAPPGLYQRLYDFCEETGAVSSGRIWDRDLRSMLVRRAYLLEHGLPVQSGYARDGQLAAYDTLRKIIKQDDPPLFCADWIATLRGMCLQLYRESKTGAAFYEGMIALAGEPQVREALALADRGRLDGKHRRFYDAFVARKWMKIEKKMKWAARRPPLPLLQKN